MTLSTAIDNLVSISVTGITNRYKPSTVPSGFISDSDLPATVLQLANTGGEGLTAGNVDGSQGVFVVSVIDILLFSPGGLQRNSDGLLDAIDNYIGSLKGEHTLSGALDHPSLVVLERVGTIPYANQTYIGCIFRHKWKIRYS